LLHFNKTFGNPANGLHIQGRLAFQSIGESRDKIARCINANSNEVIFTSGASESNNLAIQGVAHSHQLSNRKRIITSAVEHKSVLNTCNKLSDEGFEVVLLPVDPLCKVSLDSAKDAINENTLLVSIQAANNEIGTIQPIAEIAELTHNVGALFHCDAAQAVGKIPVDIKIWNVDLLSISAHKLYGPKGVGALFIQGGVDNMPIEPIIYGGGQEHGLRSGTMNVTGIVGFGEACKLAEERLVEDQIQIKNLRTILEKTLTTNIPDISINGDKSDRLPNTINITFYGIDADALLLNCPNLMIGTGSACSSGAYEPSHVLQAMGLSRDNASQTIRISLGRGNTLDEIQVASEDIIDACKKIRSLSTN
jgi:cysteine desulfurase